MEDRRHYPHGSSSNSSRKRKGGWGGEELEMQHQQDVFAAKNKNKHHQQSLLRDQFQNTEVGQGYQAKHVIRQKQHSSATTAATSSSKNIIDMSGGVDFTNNKASALQSNYESSVPESTMDSKHYLQSKELCEFRKEIEKILSSS